MGWFDDNFGDLFDSDFEVDEVRCKGTTQAGKRCKVCLDSPYPTARTILSTGFCTQHLSQSGQARHSIPEEKPHPPIVTTARNGNLEQVCQLLRPELLNDAPAHDLALAVVDARRKRSEVEDDTALIAASREGHDEIVLKLLCAGADPTTKSYPSDQPHGNAMQAAEQGVSLVQRRLWSRSLTTSAAHAALLRRGRLRRIKKVIAAALDSWPLPNSPPAAFELTVRAATDLTVEELKAVLRRYHARLSGRKAELVDRVVAGGYLEQDRAEDLRKQKEMRQSAVEARKRFEDHVALRSALLREAFIEAAESPPTDAEVLAASSLTPPQQARLPPLQVKRTSDTQLPLRKSKYARIGAAKIPTPMTALTSSSCSRPRCGCGRDFVSQAAMLDHQANSSKCPWAKKYQAMRQTA